MFDELYSLPARLLGNLPGEPANGLDEWMERQEEEKQKVQAYQYGSEFLNFYNGRYRKIPNLVARFLLWLVDPEYLRYEDENDVAVEDAYDHILELRNMIPQFSNRHIIASAVNSNTRLEEALTEAAKAKAEKAGAEAEAILFKELNNQKSERIKELEAEVLEKDREIKNLKLKLKPTIQSAEDEEARQERREAAVKVGGHKFKAEDKIPRLAKAKMIMALVLAGYDMEKIKRRFPKADGSYYTDDYFNRLYKLAKDALYNKGEYGYVRQITWTDGTKAYHCYYEDPSMSDEKEPYVIYLTTDEQQSINSALSVRGNRPVPVRIP